MKPKILIVDDKVANLVALERVLAEIDAELIRATSGNQALALTLEHDFALALVDVQMPDMDGYETVDLMRQAEETRLLPVIFVSAVYSSDYHKIKGIESGAIDFIEKPFVPAVLLGKVRLFLELHNNLKSLESIHAQLAENEMKFRSICNSANDAIVMIDSDGRIIVWNPAAELMFGYSIGEVIGRDCHELLAPAADLEKIRNGFVAFQVDGTGPVIGKTSTVTAVRKNAIEFPAEISVSTVNIKGRYHAIGIVRDISDRVQAEKNIKELEAQLKQKEQLAMIGKMAASVRHDLRNPLGVISNSIYYLKMVLGQQEGKVQKHLQLLDEQIRHCDAIIGDLLDFSKETPLNPVKLYESGAFIEAILDEINCPDGIKLQKSLLASHPAVLVDLELMRRILLNLVSNAVDAMSQGGELTVSSALDDSCLEIRVIDTGCGIPVDRLENIFEPFYSSKPKGVGLGLFIVKDLVQRLQGTVAVSSKETVGTTFTVRLPLTTTADERDRPGIKENSND